MLCRELIDAAEYRRSVVPAKWPLIASLVCGGALILTSCGLATQQNHEYPATIAVFHYRGLPEGFRPRSRYRQILLTRPSGRTVRSPSLHGEARDVQVFRPQ